MAVVGNLYLLGCRILQLLRWLWLPTNDIPEKLETCLIDAFLLEFCRGMMSREIKDFQLDYDTEFFELTSISSDLVIAYSIFFLMFSSNLLMLV